jgi:hypothetical protein
MLDQEKLIVMKFCLNLPGHPWSFAVEIVSSFDAILAYL